MKNNVQVILSLDQKTLHTLLGHLEKKNSSLQAFFREAVEDTIKHSKKESLLQYKAKDSRGFKRVSAREDLRVIVARQDGSVYSDGVLLNISMGGLSVRLERASSFYLREFVEVTLLLESESHTLDAMVLWVSQKGRATGLQFVNLDYNTSLFLLQFCEKIDGVEDKE